MTMDLSCHFHSYKGPDLIGPFFVCQIPIWPDGINAIFAISTSDDKSTPRYTAAYTRPATFSGMNNSSESFPSPLSIYISSNDDTTRVSLP